jgi:glycosyltransferase involved in cell wall biosynthesis
MRILVAIPSYNEQATIADVVQGVRESLPGYDLLVVDDGSTDSTRNVLEALCVARARHLCNLGYGRAIQTAVKYANRHGYDALVTLDADGQHDPSQLRGMLEEFLRGPWDLLIGSRYSVSHDYSGAPFARRIGMAMFSFAVHLMTGRRIYDTTSGLKAMRRSTFEPLSRWHFVDFHAEALVYMMRLGYRIGEHPITVAPRQHGQSMYSLVSVLKYPLKTFMMVVLGVIHASLTKRGYRR